MSKICKSPVRTDKYHEWRQTKSTLVSLDDTIETRYYITSETMIVNFKSKEAEKIFNAEWSEKIPPLIQERVRLKLRILNAAPTMNELRLPASNHLEKLKGNRKEQYSIRINKQWRICFEWHNNNAYNVEIIDYHP